MNAISILTRVIAIVGAAAAAYFYFDLGNELQDTERQLRTEEQRRMQAEDRVRNAEQELDEMAESMTVLEGNLEEAQGRITLEQARAEELESELEESRAALASAEGERDEFRADSARYRDMYLSLREDTADLVAGDDEELIMGLQRELRRLESELETAQNRLREVDGEPEGNGDFTRTLSVVRGKISDVDSRRGFVVLDLGTNHNVRMGDVLMVHRQGTYVGRVRVSRSEATESIAQMLSGEDEDSLRRGDDVRITKIQVN